MGVPQLAAKSSPRWNPLSHPTPFVQMTVLGPHGELMGRLIGAAQPPALVAPGPAWR
jgi:hypothetical protein